MPDIAVAEPDVAPPSLRDLAVHNGLKVSGERPGLVAYGKQLWHYRHFIAAYANAKAIAAFDTARLGRLWQVLTPLTNAAVYYLIFGFILNNQKSVPNFIAYLCAGIFVFDFTQRVVLAGTQSVSGNLGLVRALHFPRATLPLAVTITHFQSLVASMAVLMGIVLVTGEPVTVQWLLIVPALLLQSIFNIGLTLVVARLGAKATDLRQVLPFLMRTWMYGSGVFYSVTNFAEHLPAWLSTIVQVNPMLVYIELVRDALVESSPLASSSMQLWLLATGWALLAVIGGFVYFWRAEQEYGRG